MPGPASGNNDHHDDERMNTQQTQPGPSAYTRAPKGKACLNCRRRKLVSTYFIPSQSRTSSLHSFSLYPPRDQKCDCAHPICGQCTRLNREKDCEYSDKDNRSRSEILEEQVALLQARLHELEHSEDCSSARLHDPPIGMWPVTAEDLDDFDILEHASIQPTRADSAGICRSHQYIHLDKGLHLYAKLRASQLRLPLMKQILQPRLL